MARRRGRRLIECIQKALNDPQPEIYQLAVAKLAQIQEEHTQQLAAARALYAGRGGRENAYALVKAYHDYLDSGLLETTLQPLYLQQLETLYGEILQLDPRDHASRLSRAAALLRLGRTEEAREQYQAVLQQNQTSPEAQLGLLEVCFCCCRAASYRPRWPSLCWRRRREAPAD